MSVLYVDFTVVVAVLAAYAETPGIVFLRLRLRLRIAELKRAARAGYG